MPFASTSAIARVVAALLTASPALAAAQPQAPDPPAAGHARLLEAFAAADIGKARPTAVIATTARQLADPAFRDMANQLAEALVARGFNIVAPPQPFTQAITLQYRVGRDTDGTLPGQQNSDPRVVKYLGDAALPAYRRITVTAYDLADRKNVKLLWRTAMDEDGFSAVVAKTIPPLISAGARYYGQHLTALAVADCNDFEAPVGSRIPESPCAPARALAATPEITKRPTVTVETPPPK